MEKNENENMKETKTDLKEDQISWRRIKVSELSVKGFSQAEIARMLQISEPTISRDIQYLKQKATETIRTHIQKRLPYEYSKCISGLEEIIKEGWIVATKANQSGDNKEKLSSLSLIKDAYQTKMDLLTNASLLKDSIKFVDSHRVEILHITTKQKKEIDKDNDLEGPAEVNTIF